MTIFFYLLILFQIVRKSELIKFNTEIGGFWHFFDQNDVWWPLERV